MGRLIALRLRDDDRFAWRHQEGGDYGEYRSRFSARCSLSQPSLTCPALMFREEEARFHATPTPNNPAMTSASQTAMRPVSKATRR